MLALSTFTYLSVCTVRACVIKPSWLDHTGGGGAFSTDQRIINDKFFMYDHTSLSTGAMYANFFH